MTKVYELPNGHRLVADIDESTRVCHITETLLDSLISKLNYYADGQTDVLPSAEKTGHWIYQGDKKKPMYAWFSCSSCGAYIGTPTWFCSECGTRMVEPQEVRDGE